MTNSEGTVDNDDLRNTSDNGAFRPSLLSCNENNVHI